MGFRRRGESLALNSVMIPSNPVLSLNSLDRRITPLTVFSYFNLCHSFTANRQVTGQKRGVLFGSGLYVEVSELNTGMPWTGL